MTKIIFAALSLVAISFPAMSADLTIADQESYSTPVTSGLYLQLLGGASLPGTIQFTGGSMDVPANWAVAGVVGFQTGIEGLSVEADVSYAQRDYLDGFDAPFEASTGGVMAAVKYTFSITDAVSLNAAVGLGGVYLRDEDSVSGFAYVDDWGTGFLLKAGATIDLTDQIGLVGEVRYSNTFDPIAAVDPADSDEQAGTAAALVGLQFGF